MLPYGILRRRNNQKVSLRSEKKLHKINDYCSVDDLFIAGILDADAMIVASPYDGECNEDYMVDAKNIIAVQKLSR